MPYYYDLTTGACRGYHDSDAPPENAVAADADPVDGRQAYIDGAWVWPTDLLRARRIAEVGGRFEAALDAGMAYGGKVLQLRDGDRDNIDAVGQEARWSVLGGGAGWDANFAWRMKDDSFLLLPTPEDMVALGEAAKAEYYRLLRVKWVHVDALKALQTVSEIEAYDIETGWQGS